MENIPARNHCPHRLKGDADFQPSLLACWPGPPGHLTFKQQISSSVDIWKAKSLRQFRAASVYWSSIFRWAYGRSTGHSRIQLNVYTSIYEMRVCERLRLRVYAHLSNAVQQISIPSWNWLHFFASCLCIQKSPCGHSVWLLYRTLVAVKPNLYEQPPVWPKIKRLEARRVFEFSAKLFNFP